MNYVYPKSDKDWQAYDDANILARAEQIKQDKERLSNAQNAAKKILEEKSKEENALRKIAGQNQRKINQSSKDSNSVKSDFNVFKKIGE